MTSIASPVGIIPDYSFQIRFGPGVPGFMQGNILTPFVDRAFIVGGCSDQSCVWVGGMTNEYVFFFLRLFSLILNKSVYVLVSLFVETFRCMVTELTYLL